MRSEEEIYKRFCRYGRIESVEIQREQQLASANENDDQKAHYYAYVTFENSKTMYLILKDVKQYRKYTDMTIVPADTWKQPSVTAKNDFDKNDDNALIDYLNDDCLIEIFRYLSVDAMISLSKTSKYIEQLLKLYIYPQCKTMHFNFNASGDRSRLLSFLDIKSETLDDGTQPIITLAELREQLQAVGNYLCDVKMIFHQEEEYLPKNVNRIIDIFSRNIGENIVKLTIDGLIITDTMLEQFKPLFARLKYLKWDGCNDLIDYDCDLINTCVNLETLKITQNIEFVVNSGKWQKLKNISIGFSEFVDSPAYPLFFINNKDIKRLSIEGYRMAVVLLDISYNLKNLEKLTISHGWSEMEAKNMRNLLEMENLRILKLLTVSKRSVNDILLLLCNMPQLSYVKLTITDDDDDYESDNFALDSVVPEDRTLLLLAKCLPLLKKFSLENCALRSETILKFIQLAKKLEVLSLCECDLSITVALIMDICNVRRMLKKKTPAKLQLIVSDFEDPKVDKVVFLFK